MSSDDILMAKYRLLNIIVENYGKKAAREYLLGIQVLSPDANIVNVWTESPEVGALYSVTNHTLQRKELEEKLADETIVLAYDDCMEIGGNM